jgi:hypothetical protein
VDYVPVLEAETELRHAIALDDNEVSAHLQYGRFLLALGWSTAAHAELMRAKSIDPLSPIVLAWTAYTMFVLGRHGVRTQIPLAGRSTSPLSSTI